MFEKVNNIFMDIYRKVTDKKYGYVVIDNTPETSTDHQIVAHVFDACKRYVILQASNKVNNEQTGQEVKSTLAIQLSNELPNAQTEVQPQSTTTIFEGPIFNEVTQSSTTREMIF